MRYFLLDKITEVKAGEYAKGIKAVTLTDPILHDHFPDYPVMPGVLIIEGLAQLAGFLLEVSFNQTDDHLVRSILFQVEKMKFYEITTPGELLEYRVEIISTIGDAARVHTEAKANSELRARGQLSFYMKAIDSVKVTNQRRYLYKLLTKGLENCPTIR